MQKAQDNAPQGAPAPRVDSSSPTDLPAGSGTMLSGLQALAPGLLDFDPAQLVDKLAALVSDDPAAMLGRSRGSRGRLRRRRSRPRREHRHPFLTARYRWITGDHLSLLDLIALVLAVPVHLAYAVFTVATTGSMREFGRDAAGLAAAMKPAPALGVGGTDDADPALGAGDPAAEPYPSAEITFTVLRVIYAGLAAASDLLFLPRWRRAEHPRPASGGSGPW